MKKFKNADEGIVYLLIKATNDDWLMIEKSLAIAKENAKNSLNTDLYDALYWPTNQIDYVNFLKAFAQWTPQQSGAIAWRKPGTLHSQEVYDRLCHYYFLVDQDIGSGNTPQDIPWFSQFLVLYADIWGDFLNTPESFSDAILQTFIKFSPQYRVQDSMIDGKPNAPWNCFNDFFSRELNPGLRPIDDLPNNQVVTMPADCTFRKRYPINNDSSIGAPFRLKQTHTIGNVKELLKGSQYAEDFKNGTFVHYFLSPYSYHRFHTPVTGIVRESYPVEGLTYLEVNLKDGQFDAPDNAENGYEFRQARGVITIDTTLQPEGNKGIVAVLPIGMCQVSSVHMTLKPSPKPVQKGTEFGKFLFGGSDIIVLFQKGMAPEIDECDVYRYYGSSMSICPPVPRKN